MFVQRIFTESLPKKHSKERSVQKIVIGYTTAELRKSLVLNVARFLGQIGRHQNTVVKVVPTQVELELLTVKRPTVIQLGIEWKNYRKRLTSTTVW